MARRNLGASAAAYRALTVLGGPAIEFYLKRRLELGREDSERTGERRGQASRPRPAGPLVWVHAASIGEALSVLRLIERLLAIYPALNVLVTTGTVTSARLLANRLPERAMHQYVPVDRPPWVRAFLDHWRPDAALWVESELWPNLVLETQGRGIPMVLVNARMSARSFARWRRFPGLVARMLRGFTLALAQDEVEAARLIALGARPVTAPGNLKYAAGPLPCEAEVLDRLRAAAGTRPRWLAASTHEGEEEIAGYVHKRLAMSHPGTLTFIVPRHPNRGAAIAAKLRAQGFAVARRAADEAIGPETDIYVGDTLGELGLFYRIAPIAFIGGSLIPHGGQNILEPARLGCAVIHGPHTENFHAIAEEMAARGGAYEVNDAEELVNTAARLLDDERLRADVAAAGGAVATAKDSILDAVVSQVEPVLAPIAVRARGTDPERRPASPPSEAAAARGGSHARP